MPHCLRHDGDGIGLYFPIATREDAEMKGIASFLFVLLVSGGVNAEDGQDPYAVATPLLIEMDLIMQYLAQEPELPTLFACKKAFRQESGYSHWQGLAEYKGLNVDFIQFYGQELERSHVLEKWRDKGFERVVLVATADETRHFLATAADIGWQPEFLVAYDLAEDTLVDKPLSYGGSMVIASKDPVFAEDIAGRITLEVMEVTPTTLDNDPLCVTRRRVGSRMMVRQCWENELARDRAREVAQQQILRWRRGTVSRPPDEQQPCVGLAAAIGQC
jgi:hypothetical protein